MPTAGGFPHKQGIISTQLLSSPSNDLVGDALSQRVPCTCRDLCQRALTGLRLCHRTAASHSSHFEKQTMIPRPTHPASSLPQDELVPAPRVRRPKDAAMLRSMDRWNSSLSAEQQQPGQTCTLLFEGLGLSLRSNNLANRVEQNYQWSPIHLNDNGMWCSCGC